MTLLDERLSGIASLVLECVKGKERPRAADIGCDHGYLTAYLLEHHPGLFMLAGDVSMPSLEKARRLLAAKGLSQRAQVVVSDGLGAVEGEMDAIVIAGMGAQTILSIVREGREKIGGALLIVQANVDLPVLRNGLAQLGFGIEKEVFTQAAGRQYAAFCARQAPARTLDAREALLGAACRGVQNAGQRNYFAWQRGVRVREMEQVAALHSAKAAQRMNRNSEELSWISEALSMNTCTVSDVAGMVGRIAPYELAEPWDNVGLLVGRAKGEVTRALVALDVTQDVIDEAKALGAQLIVTHHPMMFSPRKRLTDDDREGRLLLALAQSGIALVAAHTNLDAAPGGVNDTLMAAMGAVNVEGEGCVRVGDLPEGTTLGTLAARAQAKLHAVVRIYGAADTPVHRLGCCSGAGSGEMEGPIALGADCFITGEVKHHHALDALEAGVCVIEAGHYETENPVCEVLRGALQNAADALEYKVTFFCSKVKPFGR